MPASDRRRRAGARRGDHDGGGGPGVRARPGPTAADLHAGLRLFRDGSRFGAFDAVLAAAALALHADALVSADAAFAEVRGLAHLVPDEPSIDRLLAG